TPPPMSNNLESTQPSSLGQLVAATSRKFAWRIPAVQLWLIVFALIGVALVLLYHDAEQQDSAYHFLFARWAGRHPVYFVSVWARPLFTLIYFPVAQFGYPAAKLFTVVISLLTAWQTFRLAQQLGFDRADLAVPFLFLQPAFFALSSVVMTETLFALLFVIALRLHLSGRLKAGMLIASLLILVRPEGFFIGALWGVWILFGATNHWKAALQTLLLASGMATWWVAAYALTGDKLWIIHNWPSDWQATSHANGTGPIWWYAVQLPLIVGLPLFALFLVGLWRLLKRREFVYGTSAFLTLFVLHSVMFVKGWFGSAGYARYFVCVSPVIALITLVGWNHPAEKYKRAVRPAAIFVLLLAALTCFVYVDTVRFTRDAQGVEAMYVWLRAHRAKLFEPGFEQVSRLICSQAYTRILLDRDPWEKPPFTADRESNLELLRLSPKGTLALWDEETGPKWHRLRAEDFEASGYERLKSQDFKLEGWFVRLEWKHFGGPRFQRMHWFYKPEKQITVR
ncbi:MAG TPA: hypothetical protein PKC13_15425, partial [Blastocatellia bacterium]|nr:hypothetical protein [Blastocatellia bacterium]